MACHSVTGCAPSQVARLVELVYDQVIRQGAALNAKDKEADVAGLPDSIMSVGNTIPSDEAFRRFRGRDVDASALMRDRGFPVA